MCVLEFFSFLESHPYIWELVSKLFSSIPRQARRGEEPKHTWDVTFDGEEVYLNSGIFCVKTPLNYSETLCLSWSLLHF